MTEDHKVYDHVIINKWFATRQTSPSTDTVIRTTLSPAQQVCDTVTYLVRSSYVDANKALAWEEGEDKWLNKKLQMKANRGNTCAMHALRCYHVHGRHGIAQNSMWVHTWFKRVVDLRQVEGVELFLRMR